MGGATVGGATVGGATMGGATMGGATVSGATLPFHGSKHGGSMHIKQVDRAANPAEIPVKFLSVDHDAMGMSAPEQTVMASPTQSLLDVALEAGINIEHACGGVCACSTCHVYVEQGMQYFAEATEAEEDRVEEAPGLQRNSRLSCQCELRKGSGPIVVRIPAWNRNAVKELPH